ncbi:MAG: sigma-70 family RNA polymerase sigma factor [Anaerolineae bacterium]|jgi:RNA polymerase sigma-70 factor, ECF subfamily|nr:sigma-70 family RNA polymerase sigma factor [Anaerolineae bacterium]
MNTETELIQRASRLEGQALAEIYDAHSEAIYRYAMRLLGDVDVAEECVSETYTRFLAVLKKGKGPREYLKAYLFRIAHNWITDYYRRAAPDTEPIKDELYLASDDNPAQAAFQNMQMARTRAALKQLTPDQQEVISLKFFEGWENAEIAAAVNKPIGAVKSLQHRGLAALKRILLDDDE